MKKKLYKNEEEKYRLRILVPSSQSWATKKKFFFCGFPYLTSALWKTTFSGTYIGNSGNPGGSALKLTN